MLGLLLECAALLVAAWLCARLADKIGLPPLLGMLAGGLLVGALEPPLEPGLIALDDLSPHVRIAILAVVLLRAGLGITLEDVRSAGPQGIRLAGLSVLGDAAFVASAAVLLLGLRPSAAVALGFLVAAISPAIVIPGLLELLGSHRGRAQRILSTLLVGAPLDNIIALIGLSVALDGAASGSVSWTDFALLLPYRVVVGIALGVSVGLLVSAVVLGFQTVSRYHIGGFVLWAGAGLVIGVGRWLDVSFVLGVIALGAVVQARAPQPAEQLAHSLRRFWSVLRYALFGLIGASVDLQPLVQVGPAVVAVVCLGQLGRALGSFAATAGLGFSLKERLACILAYVPKATIQAAFAGVALDRGLAEGGLILTTAVLAIIITVPVGVTTLMHGTDALLRDRSPPGSKPRSPVRG